MPDYLYRIFIIGGSGTGKIKQVLELSTLKNLVIPAESRSFMHQSVHYDFNFYLFIYSFI